MPGLPMMGQNGYSILGECYYREKSKHFMHLLSSCRWRNKAAGKQKVGKHM